MANEAMIRLRLQDHIGGRGSLILPVKDEITQPLASDWQDIYRSLTHCGARVLNIIRVVQRYTEVPTSGPTSLMYDMAVMVFETSGPFGLRFPIYAPMDIFMPDDITIDDDNLNVIAMVDFIMQYGQDKAGNNVIAYLGGKRIGAGGP